MTLNSEWHGRAIPCAAEYGAGVDPADRDAVGEEWVAAQRQRVWRKHSDWVNTRLLKKWLAPSSAPTLKTDLFDEALSDGLVPVLRTIGGPVHGVDISAPTARAAQERHADLRTCVADIRDLPYEDATFQTVVSLSTLDHFTSVSDIQRGLYEIRRVTKPGGRLILTLDNPINPKIALRARLSDRFLQRTGLVPYMCGETLSPNALRRATEDAGFSVLEEASILHCPRIPAVALCGLAQKYSATRFQNVFLYSLRYFEALGHLPTRYLTGHFSAILATADA